MYVNLNRASLKCHHCAKINHTKEMASQLISKLNNMEIQKDKDIELLIKCSFCHEIFLARVLVEKKGLVYFLED